MMRKFSIWILWMVGLSAISCDNDPDLGPSKITFSFSSSANSANGKIREQPVPAMLVLSIKDQSGNFVHNRTQLKLSPFGSGYLSETIEIFKGAYSIIEFYALDENGKIVYATPLSGSLKAPLVEHPLPYIFLVEPDTDNTVPMEVVAVEEDDTPSNFGYTAFGLKIVEGQVSELTIEIPLVDLHPLDIDSARAYIVNVSSGKFERGWVSLKVYGEQGLISGRVRIPKGTYYVESHVHLVVGNHLVAVSALDNQVLDLDTEKIVFDTDATSGYWHAFGNKALAIYQSTDPCNLSVKVYLDSDVDKVYTYVDRGWIGMDGGIDPLIFNEFCISNPEYCDGVSVVNTGIIKGELLLEPDQNCKEITYDNGCVIVDTAMYASYTLKTGGEFTISEYEFLYIGVDCNLNSISELSSTGQQKRNRVGK